MDEGLEEMALWSSKYDRLRWTRLALPGAGRGALEVAASLRLYFKDPYGEGECEGTKTRTI